MSNSPFVLIMAGGIGSRFWPASRENLPKQFLDITGAGRTLIQMTFDRFASFVPVENIYVITHENYIDQTLKAIPNFNPENLITEPSRNNTASSIALGSFKLFKKDPDAVCIVAPADHIIRDENEFQKIVVKACDFAGAHPCIITLGIKPTRPDTGYGYIEFGHDDDSPVRKVKSFKEKPTIDVAQQYIKTGNFAWNAGIFVWKLNQILEEFKIHAPGIYSVLEKGMDYYNTILEKEFILSEYPKTEKISVDYAILEKAENVFTIPCDIGWSDIGTWNSLYDISGKDPDQNAVLSKTAYLEDTHHSLILSSHPKLIVIKGLEDYIIVDTDDCLLIIPKSDEQEIKSLKEILKNKGLGNYL